MVENSGRGPGAFGIIHFIFNVDLWDSCTQKRAGLSPFWVGHLIIVQVLEWGEFCRNMFITYIFTRNKVCALKSQT